MATKDGQRIDAELVDQSAAGCERRMVQNGDSLQVVDSATRRERWRTVMMCESS
jgi:hypothetical protein